MIKKLLATLYGIAVAWKNQKIDSGKKPTVKLIVPVIGVGNVSVGGTGKTPMVQYIVRLLQAKGFRVGVVLRGYKRSTKGLLVVRNIDTLQCTVRESGDEAMQHALELQVPVVVHERKFEAAVFMGGHLDVDVIVVDDAFQHRVLHRDIDVVLVDKQTVDNPELLPAGRLREPLSNISRANIVMLMNTPESRSGLSAYTHPLAPMCDVRTHTVVPVALRTGKPVVLVTGIANPERVAQALQQQEIPIAEHIRNSDHYSYGIADVQRIIQSAKKYNTNVLTTSKDRVKLNEFFNEFEKENVELVTAEVQLEITSGREIFEQTLINTVETWSLE